MSVDINNAAHNNMQQQQQQQYADYVYDEPEPEPESSELSRSEYLKHCELDYTPSIVRWLKANYLHSKDDAVLVSGSNHCFNYLQVFRFAPCDDTPTMQVSADVALKMPAEIADIQFADDQTAVAVSRNGQIQLVRVQRNDDSNGAMDSDCKHDADVHNKWSLSVIGNAHHAGICCPDERYQQYPAALTSVTVNNISGKAVAADENGFVYITDIDAQKYITSQRCCSSAINSIQFVNSYTLASVSMSGQLLLWDLREGRGTGTDLNVSHATALPHKHGALMSLCVHPFRNHIFATGTEYGTVAIWDIRSGKSGSGSSGSGIAESYQVFRAHTKYTLVNDVKFLSNTSNKIHGLVTCGNDGVTQMITQQSEEDWKHLTQSVWDVNTVPIQEEKYAVNNVDFNAQLNVVATVCDSQKLSFFPI